MGRSRTWIAALLLVAAAACGNSPTTPPDRGPVYGPCGLRPNYVDDVILNRWPAFPLTYFLDAATFTADFREEYRAAIAAGIRRWDAATENELGAVVEVEDRDGADFLIILGTVAAPQVAAQTVHRTGTPFLAGGVIGFNAPFFQEGEDLVRAGTIGRDTFFRVVEAVAAHEMGHLMGIIGHPLGDDTLMGRESTLAIDRPTPADVNTLTHAYCR